MKSIAVSPKRLLALLVVALLASLALRVPTPASASQGSSSPVTDRAVAGQGALPPVYLPIGLRGASAASLPAPVVVPRVPTATASPILLPSPTPTETVEPSPTSTATPAATPTSAGYAEALTDHPDISDLRDAYAPARWYETLLAVLERRYATGRDIVTRLSDSRTNASRWAGGQPATFNDLLRRTELIVHEMDHQLGWQEGLEKSQWQRYAYVVRSDLTVEVTNHETFARSEIAQYVTGPLVNMYKSTYLTGSSGNQGFMNLLDEVNAYTHSLFTGYGLYDQYSPNSRVSHRDGMVTFLMYTQFYLRQARLRHADTYALLHGDPEVRALVRLLWDRAQFILDVTAPIERLAMDPVAIEAEMRKADMIEEIERFIEP